MEKVESKDGTVIAYDRVGSGPPVILVDGALCYRDQGPMPELATELAGNFTVVTYDRRGRGDSGNTLPYAPEREVEDLAALLDAVGGTACVYGISSGAALTLEAASALPGVRRLAVYEAPFVVDDTLDPLPEGWLEQLEGHVAAGRRGDAVRQFMKRVGVPGFAVWMMRLMPVWKKLASVAHTLPYDFAVVGDTQHGRPLPRERWAGARMPALAMVGGKSPEWMHSAMRGVAEVLPDTRFEVIEGQTHMLKAEAVAPRLIGFFGE